MSKDRHIYGCAQCDAATPKPVLNRTGGYCEAHAFMTIAEAHTALRVSRASYYNLCRSGKLSPRKVGLGVNGRVVVPRKEVDMLLQNPA